LREGKEIEVEIKLSKLRLLVPQYEFDKLPSFFIMAGLVFMPLRATYLYQKFGRAWMGKAPISLVNKALNGHIRYPDEEIVILSQILVAEINFGYQFVSLIVNCFNGTPIRNLQHLVQMIENNTDEFLRFDMDHERVIIIGEQAAKKDSATILEKHGISSPKSKDLL